MQQPFISLTCQASLDSCVIHSIVILFREYRKDRTVIIHGKKGRYKYCYDEEKQTVTDKEGNCIKLYGSFEVLI